MHRYPYIESIRLVADAMSRVDDEVVFVGGSVLGLYIRDSVAAEVRPTMDIDVFLHVVSASDAENIRQRMITAGFQQLAEDTVMCRFRLSGTVVDVMSTTSVSWMPSNRWFLPGLSHTIRVDIDGIGIRLLSLPYFISAKWDAFQSRGMDEPRLSHDFEDIAWLIDHVVDLDEILSASDEHVRRHVIHIFELILERSDTLEALRANIEPATREARYQAAIARLRHIVR